MLICDSQNCNISDDGYNNYYYVIAVLTPSNLVWQLIFSKQYFQDFVPCNNYQIFLPFEGWRWVFFGQENARMAAMGTPSKSSTSRSVELAITVWMVLKFAYNYKKYNNYSCHYSKSNLSSHYCKTVSWYLILLLQYSMFCMYIHNSP